MLKTLWRFRFVKDVSTLRENEVDKDVDCVDTGWTLKLVNEINNLLVEYKILSEEKENFENILLNGYSEYLDILCFYKEKIQILGIENYDIIKCIENEIF